MARGLSFCASCQDEWPDSCIDASGKCDRCRESAGGAWRCPNDMGASGSPCPQCGERHTCATDRTFAVAWSVEDNEWVATCHQLPSLSWLENSAAAALDGLLTLIFSLDLAQATAAPSSSRPRAASKP